MPVMGTRTVRLDDQTEELLRKLRRKTGLSISEVLKRGVKAFSENAVRETAATPYEVYRRIDLGPGGYARSPARGAKKAVRAAIARKHGR
jgi:hypothetical protein